jgi:carbamoyl-phosphate synthase small subunit
VRRIRSEGAMRAGLSTEIDDPEELHRRVLASPQMVGSDLALSVSTKTSHLEAGGRGRKRYRVAAVDYGMKRNIVRLLQAGSCRVEVFPATAGADEILASRPDGIFLSNGPGDPAALAGPIRTIQALVQAGKPIFGICLGHQLLGLAFGASTFKLKFGHRGANHPVQDIGTGHVAITSQNHGFAVDPGSLPEDDRAHAPQPQRRHSGGVPAPDPAHLRGAVPSRGRAGAARRERSLRPVPASDGEREAPPERPRRGVEGRRSGGTY